MRMDSPSCDEKTETACISFQNHQIWTEPTESEIFLYHEWCLENLKFAKKLKSIIPARHMVVRLFLAVSVFPFTYMRNKGNIRHLNKDLAFIENMYSEQDPN